MLPTELYSSGCVVRRSEHDLIAPRNKKSFCYRLFEALDWKVVALDYRGEPAEQQLYVGRNMNLFAAPRRYYEEVILS
jgi:hypothetical protein